jgi:uncharacterized protein YecT (DUF1311 family)
MRTSQRGVRTAVFVGTVMLVAPTMHSQEVPAKCRDGGQTQLEMNACAGQKADSAKRRLAALLAELDGVLQPHVRQSLANVQARWSELRDLDCDWERSMFQGGSVAPMVYANCIAAQTEQRIGRLKPFLCEGAGMTAPCEASGKY